MAPDDLKKENAEEFSENYQDIIVINFENVSKSSEIEFALKMGEMFSGEKRMFSDIEDQCFYEQTEYEKHGVHIFVFIIIEILLILTGVVLLKYGLRRYRSRGKG